MAEGALQERAAQDMAEVGEVADQLVTLCRLEGSSFSYSDETYPTKSNNFLGFWTF